MQNNVILRRVRYTFELDDNKMMAIFALGGLEVTRESLCNWLKQEEAEDFVALNDKQLSTFLNGFIIEKRGARDGGPPAPDSRLNNNMVFNKLKIALALQSDDVLALIESAGLQLSKHELSAFFRKPGNKQYRECLDQVLRNFLNGLQEQHRPQGDKAAFDWGERSQS